MSKGQFQGVSPWVQRVALTSITGRQLTFLSEKIMGNRPSWPPLPLWEMWVGFRERSPEFCGHLKPHGSERTGAGKCHFAPMGSSWRPSENRPCPLPILS